jgi:hypothetical protein
MILCNTYTNATFEPNTIWETNSNNAVSAKINIPDNIVISDVNFYMNAKILSLSHQTPSYYSDKIKKI